MPSFHIWWLTFASIATEGTCNQLNYYQAAETHQQRTEQDFIANWTQQYISYCLSLVSRSAYVTGTLDLIQKQSTVKDFKRGRGEGPELLMLQHRLLEHYCISFIWSWCILVSTPMPLAHQQDPGPNLQFLTWPSYTSTAVKSVPSN